MIIGLPKEVKTKENRVALKPVDVQLLVSDGHEVKVQKNAGYGAGYLDVEYEKAGATMVETAEEAYDAEMVMKVKEPIKPEYDLLKPNTILYTYLHLAADENTKELTTVLLDKNITGIAYETVTDGKGNLPLLQPMSLIAGQLAIDYGARFLQTFQGGRGKLIGAVEGADPTNIVILGAGNVGYGSLVKAAGSMAQTYVLDINPKKIAELANEFKDYKNVEIIESDAKQVEKYVLMADLFVGAVLVPGGKAPKIVTEELIKKMKDGAVIVDVAIDQGGCTELSRPTTHEDPIYEMHGKIFCCITNMPGSVARTSTQALTAATVPYAIKLANKGFDSFLKEDKGFAEGVNTYKGFITYEAVAKDLEMVDKYKKLEDLI